MKKVVLENQNNIKKGVYVIFLGMMDDKIVVFNS